MPNGKFSHDAKRPQLHKWTQYRKHSKMLSPINERKASKIQL